MGLSSIWKFCSLTNGAIAGSQELSSRRPSRVVGGVSGGWSKEASQRFNQCLPQQPFHKQQYSVWGRPLSVRYQT